MSVDEIQVIRTRFGGVKSLSAGVCPNGRCDRPSQTKEYSLDTLKKNTRRPKCVQAASFKSALRKRGSTLRLACSNNRDAS